MADNTTLNLGLNGDVIGSDDIGGVKFQRIKLIHGADGVNAGDVSGANGLPVARTVKNAAGTITTQNLVPAGAATAGSAVEITLADASTLAIQTTGVYTGALSLQVTLDGTTWVTLGGVSLINVSTGGYLATITSALQSVFQADVGGALKARITGLAAMTGTATVTIYGAADPSMVALDAAIPAGTNSIGSIATVTTVTTVSSATPVTPTTTFTNSAATTNATSTKATAGTLWTVSASNLNAAVRFLKLYNLTVAPTVGTSVPVMTIPLPPGGEPVQIHGGANGIRFSSGIAWAITALAADTDATAVAAGEHKVAVTFT